MKTSKILSVLICLAICAAFVLVPVTKANATPADITMEASWSYGGTDDFLWKPTESGTYTITIDECSTSEGNIQVWSTSWAVQYGDTIYTAGTVEVEAGKSYYVQAGGDMSGTMKYTITYGTPDNGADNVVTIVDGVATYKWTAPASGDYTVTFTEDINFAISAQFQILGGDLVIGNATNPQTFTAVEGVEYTITASYPPIAAGTVTFNVAAAEEGGEEGDGNTATVNFSGGAGEYVWTATMSGEVTVTVELSRDSIYLFAVGSATMYSPYDDPIVSGSTNSLTFTAEAGTEYKALFWTNSESASGTATFTFAGDNAGSEEPGEEPIVITPLPLDENMTIQEDIVYGYTAAEDGTLTLNNLVIMMGGKITVYIEGNKDNAQVFTAKPADPVAIALKAGEKLIIEVEAGLVGFKATFEKAPIETTALPLDQNMTIQENNVYGYTAAEDGTLTLNNMVIMMGGKVTVYIEGNKDNAQVFTSKPAEPVAIELKAGQKLIIEVEAGLVGFKATFAGATVAPDPLPLDKNVSLNPGDSKVYAFTATEGGKLSISCGASIMGNLTVKVYINNDQENAITLGAKESTTLTLVQGDIVTVEVTSAGYSSFQASFASGSAENPFIINELPCTIETGDYFAWTASSAGTVTFLFDKNTVTLNLEGAVEIEGGVTYQVSAGDTIKFCAEGETIKVDISFEIARDGSQNAPFLIEGETLNVTVGSDLWYEWVSPITGNLFVQKPDGCYVSGINTAYENIEGGYKIAVTEGQIVKMNIWNTGLLTEDYQVTFTVRALGDEPADETLTELGDITCEIASGNAYSYDWVADKDGKLTLTFGEHTMGYGYTVTVYHNGQEYDLAYAGPVELDIVAGQRVMIKVSLTAAAAGGTISFNADFEAEGGEQPGGGDEGGENVPDFGDNTALVFVLAAASMMALAVVVGKKKAF